MDEVWSVLIWLNGAEADGEPAEKARLARIGGEQSRNHRSRVFNPPSLQRVHYAHYNTRDAAEAAMMEIGELLQRNRPLMIRGENHGYLVPAHSISYLAMGKGDHVDDESVAD